MSWTTKIILFVILFLNFKLFTIANRNYSESQLMEVYVCNETSLQWTNILNIGFEVVELYMIYYKFIYLKYLKFQKTYATVIVSNSRDCCLINNLTNPRIVYWSMKEFLRAIQPPFVYNFIQENIIYSYILDCSNVDTAIRFFELKISHKSNSFYFVIFNNPSNVTPRDIEYLFRFIWSKWKILHAFIFINDIFYFFNPFQINEFNQRGKVEFLMSCQQELILKVIAQQPRDLNGFEMVIFAQNVPLVCERIYNQLGQIVGFDYVEGEFLDFVRRTLNFTPIFVGPETQFKNQSESLQKHTYFMTENNIADLMINAKSIKNYSMVNTVLLWPLTFSTSSIIVPIEYSSNHLNIFIYRLFDLPTVVLSAVSIIAVSGIWYAMNNHQEKFSIPIMVISSQFGISVAEPKMLRNRICFLTLLLYAMVINNTYQGTIIQQLSAPNSVTYIKTLDELIRSNLQIGIISFFSTEKSFPEWQQKSSRNKLFFDVLDGVNAVAHGKKTALYLPDFFIGRYKAQTFDPRTGDDLIRRISETVTSSPIAFAAIKTSPFLTIFNDIMLLYIECGIKLYQNMRVTHQTNLFYIRRMKMISGFQANVKQITVDDMYILFLVWGWMVLLAFGVFLLELLFFKWKNYKH